MNSFWRLTFSIIPQEKKYVSLSKKNFCSIIFCETLIFFKIGPNHETPPDSVFFQSSKLLLLNMGFSAKIKPVLFCRKPHLHSFERKGKKSFVSLFPSSLSKDFHTEIIFRPSLAYLFLLPCTDKLCGDV